MEYYFKTVSSLEKIFFDKPDNIKELKSATMLKNERYSFQIAVWCESDEELRKKTLYLCVNSELSPFIKAYSVGYVPSVLPSVRFNDDDRYITKKPGLFPDPLYPLKNNEFEVYDCQARALWISIEPDGKMSGKFPVNFEISDDSGKIIHRLKFDIEIIDANLPAQKLKCTSWFHGDCIAAEHGLEIMSDEYFDTVDKYMEVYASFGHNMILTPVFTPSLDTEIGAERLTNQLVDVFCDDGQYSFGFANLERWINLARKNGIEYFEISHFFTQWGAKHTPKIMATVNGEYKRIFGWDTNNDSPEYKEFLDCFLPELKAELKKIGVYDKCFFHISDEPREDDAQSYNTSRNLILPHINEDVLIDALANYELYKRGYIKTPIVSNDHINKFIEEKVPNLWTYYCCAQGKDVSNRFMAMPSYRNRILGYQMYKYNIQGFLHWGFNFWFSRLSKKAVNPYMNTDADGWFQSGDPFVVYPMNDDKDVICSLRLYVFFEALQDMRALELLESLEGREKVEKMLTDIVLFDKYPGSSEYIINLREEVNKAIKDCILSSKQGVR